MKNKRIRGIKKKMEEKGKISKTNKLNKSNKLREINPVKYLAINVAEEDCFDGVKAYDEQGNMITDRKDIPLDYGDFNIKIDVDNGKILDWPEKKISAKIYIRAKDTGFYNYYDKDNKVIYQESEYVPDFLGINQPAYGDDINFDIDLNGFILKWKEKNIKAEIVKYLEKNYNNK